MSDVYYLLEDDQKAHNRWFFKEPHDRQGNPVWAQSFTDGTRVTVPSPLYLDLSAPGKPVDYTFGAFSMPIVTAALGEALAACAPDDVQLIRAILQGSTDPYYVLNVTSRVKCLDEKKGVLMWRKREEIESPEDSPYEMVDTFAPIHYRAIRSQRMFRLHWWECALVIAQPVADLLRARQVTGIKLYELANADEGRGGGAANP